MTEKSKFTLFEGVTIENLKDSKDIVGDAVRAAAKQSGPVGAILEKALMLSGSDGEVFSKAVQSYSEAYNPILSKMMEELQKEDVRNAVIDKLTRGTRFRPKKSPRKKDSE